MNQHLKVAAAVPCRLGPRAANPLIASSRRHRRRKVPTDDDRDKPPPRQAREIAPPIQPNESDRMTSTTLGRMAALLIGFTAALTGVAQAATQSTASLAPPNQTGLPPAVGKNYHVTVHTGNRSGAGTDSNVFLRLYGTTGVSPEVQLDNQEDNFERNKWDQFDFRFADLGTLTKACVRFDRLSGDSAAWYLDWVEVNGEFFQYYRWFEKDETICRYA
jgi:hypothetical protein